MRQLERWYDISVSYEGNGYTDEYVGIISRNVNISQILKMLEKTSEARFQINGKNIIVNISGAMSYKKAGNATNISGEKRLC